MMCLPSPIEFIGRGRFQKEKPSSVVQSHSHYNTSALGVSGLSLAEKSLLSLLEISLQKLKEALGLTCPHARVLMGSRGVSAWIKWSHSADPIPSSHFGHVSCLNSSFFTRWQELPRPGLGTPQLVHSCYVLSLGNDSLPRALACFDSQLGLWLDLHWLLANGSPQLSTNTALWGRPAHNILTKA